LPEDLLELGFGIPVDEVGVDDDGDCTVICDELDDEDGALEDDDFPEED
jgi:hypothetical protein